MITKSGGILKPGLSGFSLVVHPLDAAKWNCRWGGPAFSALLNELERLP